MYETISFTGHRRVTYDSIKNHLVSLYEKYPSAIGIVGGAVGADSAIAKFAIEKKILFRLILPFTPKVMV